VEAQLTVAGPALLESWSGEDVRLSDVEGQLARLRDASSGEGRAPNLRTSVMTHLAWVPEPWVDAARSTLSGLGEEHPSRTILLFPQPDAGQDRLDATASVECYELPGTDRRVCSEIVEVHLLGRRAKAPASVVSPLLISDLPVFCRWRGEPPFGAPELDQLVELADRLIVDSTEWDDLPYAYTRLVELFPRTAVSDIAWARTARWRALLASLWPGIADVRTIRVTGTAAQGHLLAGWLRSRLDRDIALEHVEAELLVGIDLDGEPAPFPTGDAPPASELLSAELDRFTRDPIYEAASGAAGSS
jgi:alkylhydroperoxidase family enzyme